MIRDQNTQKNAVRAPIRTNGGQPLLTRVFDAFADRRRRYTLYYLQDTQHTQLDDLAAQIAAWEQNTTCDAVAVAHRERIYRDLVHSHFPKLADYNLVDYDARSATVRLTDPPPILDDALILAGELEKPS